jgi:hypothetical protein
MRAKQQQDQEEQQLQGAKGDPRKWKKKKKKTGGKRRKVMALTQANNGILATSCQERKCTEEQSVTPLMIPIGSSSGSGSTSVSCGVPTPRRDLRQHLLEQQWQHGQLQRLDRLRTQLRQEGRTPGPLVRVSTGHLPATSSLLRSV